MCIFKSPRDETSVGVVATQSFKAYRKAFLKIFHHVTRDCYQNLFVDLTAQCPRPLQLRGSILDPHPKIYVPKGI